MELNPSAWELACLLSNLEALEFGHFTKVRLSASTESKLDPFLSWSLEDQVQQNMQHIAHNGGLGLGFLGAVLWSSLPVPFIRKGFGV